MIGNCTGISIVELWPFKDTFPTFLHGEVVAAVNKMLTDKCITCQKISGHDIYNVSLLLCLLPSNVQRSGKWVEQMGSN